MSNEGNCYSGNIRADKTTVLVRQSQVPTQSRPRRSPQGRSSQSCQGLRHGQSGASHTAPPSNRPALRTGTILSVGYRHSSSAAISPWCNSGRVTRAAEPGNSPGTVCRITVTVSQTFTDSIDQY